MLRRVIGQPPAQVVAITVDWATARETSPLGAMPSMFSLVGRLDEEDGGHLADLDADSVLRHLAEVPEQERPAVVSAHLQDLAARVLQLDTSRVSEQDSLTNLGMDSMMAIEVKQRIETALQVDVSVLELLQGATIAELAERILTSLHVDESAAAATAAADDAAGAPADAAPEQPVDDQLAEIQRLLTALPNEDLDELLNQLERDAT
jgi:acyl carrier protein